MLFANVVVVQLILSDLNVHCVMYGKYEYRMNGSRNSYLPMEFKVRGKASNECTHYCTETFYHGWIDNDVLLGRGNGIATAEG